jgi:septum formation protein
MTYKVEGTMQPLILASSSQARKTLLERFQIPFKIVSPDIDETPYPNEQPYDHVIRLSKEKAMALSKQFPDALIIGADTIGALDQIILSKPLTHENAVQQLQMVSEKFVQFYSGMCLYNAKTQQSQHTCEKFDIKYKKLSMTMILNYLKKENPIHCAGSLKIEGLGIALIEKMTGEDINALIGLPLMRLSSFLANEGVDILMD